MLTWLNLELSWTRRSSTTATSSEGLVSVVLVVGEDDVVGRVDVGGSDWRWTSQKGKMEGDVEKTYRRIAVDIEFVDLRGEGCCRVSGHFFFLPVVAEEDDVESRRGVVVVEGRRKGKGVEVEVRVSMGMSWQRWSLPNAP